jgi:transcriptional regulator with XRE-family HTH domain
MEFGEILKNVRKKQNKTLADFCGYIVTPSQLSKIENCKSEITLYNFMMLLEQNEVGIREIGVFLNDEEILEEDRKRYVLSLYEKQDIASLERMKLTIEKNIDYSMKTPLMKRYLLVKASILTILDIEATDNKDENWILDYIDALDTWTLSEFLFITNILGLMPYKTFGVMAKNVTRELKKILATQNVTNSEMFQAFNNLQGFACACYYDGLFDVGYYLYEQTKNMYKESGENFYHIEIANHFLHALNLLLRGQKIEAKEIMKELENFSFALELEDVELRFKRYQRIYRKVEERYENTNHAFVSAVNEKKANITTYINEGMARRIADE